MRGIKTKAKLKQTKKNKMNKQEEYNKLLNAIEIFERIATKEERIIIYKAIQEYIKQKLRE